MDYPNFVAKVYTVNEQQLLEGRPTQSWAARFAGKEAVMKAIGSGWSQGVRFNEIEIIQDNLGKPVVVLSGSTKKRAKDNSINQIHISLSHDGNIAIAYAIAVGEGS